MLLLVLIIYIYIYLGFLSKLRTPKPSYLCAICDLGTLRKIYLAKQSVKATKAITQVYVKKLILRLFVCL